MYSRSQPLCLGDSPKKRDELLALQIAQHAEQRVLMLAGDLSDFPQHLPSLRRQEEGVRAPIGGMGAPLDQAASLELIDQLDELARYHGEGCGEGSLTLPFGGRDNSEKSDLRKLQPQPGDPLREHLGGVRSDLREQESR